jgi:hypothetical protein
LGSWREVVQVLGEALATGGKAAAHAAWQALCRARPELAQLMDGERAPILVCLQHVQPATVEWLWSPYVPKRKLTLLEGDPGVGKTFLALAIVAAETVGRHWPDAQARGPGTALYLSAEDGIEDTLTPRLIAMGADRARVYVLKGWRTKTAEGVITLADIDVIERAIREKAPTLVVIDPLQAFIGAGVDMHRANEVRAILSGLVVLAERYGCAILIVRHWTKAAQDRAIYRGLGSIDFSAAARSILVAGKDPKHPERFVMAHGKSSLAPTGPSLAYELGDGRFRWIGQTTVTADAMARPPQVEEEGSALEEARDFLHAVLAEGPQPAKEVVRAARGAGIAAITLRRARQGLVSISRVGLPGQGKGGGAWMWSLLRQDPPGHQGDHPDHGEHPPPSTPDEHLNRNDFLQENQGDTPHYLDAHMSILKEDDFLQQNQGDTINYLDAHGVCLGGKARGDHDDHLKQAPRCLLCRRALTPGQAGATWLLCGTCAGEGQP